MTEKEEIRRKQQYLRFENRRHTSSMREIPRSEWPAGKDAPGAPVAAFRSKDFLAQIYHERGHVRISVNRTMIDGTGNWLEGISWDDLQRIKNEVGYGNSDAIELYPASKDVVNVANIRHLWVLPSGSEYAWRSRS